MLLDPSTAGGKTVGGVKQRVLWKRDGSDITPNSRPSRRDVQGLKKMYGVKTTFIKKYLGDTSSTVKNMFNNIRKKDPDSSCV